MLKYFTHDLCVTMGKKKLNLDMHYLMWYHSYDDSFDAITLNGLLRRPGVLVAYVCVYASTSIFHSPPLFIEDKCLDLLCVCVCAGDVLSTQRGTVPLKLARGFHGALVHPALVWLLISLCDEHSRHIKRTARVPTAYGAYGDD